MVKTNIAKLILLIFIIVIGLAYLEFTTNIFKYSQTQCEKIKVIASNQTAVGQLDRWASEHVIDKGYNFVSGMHGSIVGTKGDAHFTITPLPDEKVTGIELRYFRLSVSKSVNSFDAEITNNNVGQIDFGRGRDQVILLKNGTQLESYRGHDESSGHLLQISKTVFAYCANAKFEI